MRRNGYFLLVTLAAACSATSGPAGTTTSTSSPSACVVGTFVSAFEDDGHGVSVELSGARTSANGYQPTGESQYYVHDEGNPTRGLSAGDEVWLIRNPPGAAWDWRYLTADQARAECPAPPGA